MRWATFWLSIVLSVPAQAEYLFYISTQSFPYAEGSGELPAILAKIDSTAAACASLPTRGTVYYFCDCGAGAEGDCVVGDNANAGTNPSAPKRTIAAATTLTSSWNNNTNHTIAFCKGGAFETVSAYGEPINRLGCTAGTTCDDWREYSPTTFTGTAKPLIVDPVAGPIYTIRFESGAYGGIRFLNLATEGNNHGGFHFYNGAHDVTMCNLSMNGHSLPFSLSTNTGKTLPNEIHIEGNYITNSVAMGYQGGGNNVTLSYNSWIGNGATNVQDHTIYIGSEQEIVNFKMNGNYIFGQYGSSCLGNPVVGHAAVVGFEMINNYIELDPAETSGGCWGIGLGNNTGNVAPVYWVNATVSNNTIINGGNTGIYISGCPSCVIENNRIVMNWPYGNNLIKGIHVVRDINRGQDLDSNANHIRNNTIFFGSATTGTNIGVVTDAEGTGHTLSNNSIVSEQSSGELTCFGHDWGGKTLTADTIPPLPLSAYAFQDNNHCYRNGTFYFGRLQTQAYIQGVQQALYTYYDLSAWQSYSSFDANSVTGNPAFTNPSTYDFRSTYLGGKGNNTYKSLTGFTGNTRASPPAIGAFEP
jgi:parallel beta-helix repeat protein